MSDIKSAWEKALEKVEKMGQLSPDESMKLEHVPAGNALAAKYLNDDSFNLDAELGKYKGRGEVRKYVIEGVQEVLLHNITLPRDEKDKRNTSRAISGLKLIKENQKQLQAILDMINNVLSYYEQSLQQTFMKFKQDFEAKTPDIIRALQQRGAGKGQSPEIELQMLFQEEWRRASRDLDSKYNMTLQEHKKKITELK